MSALSRQTARDTAVAAPGGCGHGYVALAFARRGSARRRSGGSAARLGAARRGSGRETPAVQPARRYLAADLTSIFFTGSFFSVWSATETMRMPSW